MRTTKLGQLTVSAQGLGCMGMSEWYGATDWDESIATIHRALDLGVTFIDTADIYGAGHNGVLVGRGIAGRRDEVQLATKFGIDRSAGDAHRVLCGEAAYVQRSCEASLTRLGVEVIDLHYLHRPAQTAGIEETVGTMATSRRGPCLRTCTRSSPSSTSRAGPASETPSQHPPTPVETTAGEKSAAAITASVPSVP